MSRNIIGLSGRMGSGKSVISEVTSTYGYEILYFASPLKDLISELISIPRKDLDSYKTVIGNYKILSMDCTFIANETDVPLKIVKEKLLNKTFATVRDLLQVIGTDLIREYNKNWHVDRIREIIEANPETNYVLGDVRFLNERKMVEDLGGSCWYIVRPKLDNVSNHVSEISLKWQDFDNIIINDKSEDYLRFNWCIFMENGYEDSLRVRNEILHKLHGNKEMINELVLSKEPFTLLDAMFISKYEFTYDAKYFIRTLKGIQPIISSVGSGYVVVTYSKDSISGEICENPLMIEDLKMYV